MKKIKIIHKREKCIGCNSCVQIAPEIWMMNKKDGKSELIGSKLKKNLYIGEIFECDIDKAKKCADACPMQIIIVNTKKSC